MQDAKTVYAVLDPMKLLGPSAFGPLKFRPVNTDGVEGDWQPLVNLVRMPELKVIQCPPSVLKRIEKNLAAMSDSENPAAADVMAAHSETGAPEKCLLSGDKLFLIDAVSADPAFTTPVMVPDGFVEGVLSVPTPKNKVLYMKLRDDPAAVDTAILPLVSTQAKP